MFSNVLTDRFSSHPRLCGNANVAIFLPTSVSSKLSRADKVHVRGGRKFFNYLFFEPERNNLHSGRRKILKEISSKTCSFNLRQSILATNLSVGKLDKRLFLV